MLSGSIPPSARHIHTIIFFFSFCVHGVGFLFLCFFFVQNMMLQFVKLLKPSKCITKKKHLFNRNQVSYSQNKYNLLQNQLVQHCCLCESVERQLSVLFL